MADTKVSDLVSADPLDGTEKTISVQDSTSKYMTVDQIKDYINGGIGFNPIASQVFGG